VSEHDHEPVPGLPAALPQDEHILWQGAPDWKQMVMGALHIRLTAVYFGGIILWAVLRGDSNTAIGVSALAAAVIAMLVAFAWGVGRTTIYTLTNKRIVLRVGVALDKCINLPLTEVEAADLKMIGGGYGNVVLSLKGMPRLGYLLLWPHARSLRMMRPQPMLRAIPDAEAVARLLYKATQRVQPITTAAAPPAAMPDRDLAGVPA
jgi:hypothetical protein